MLWAAFKGPYTHLEEHFPPVQWHVQYPDHLLRTGEEQGITEVHHTISWCKALFLLSRQYKGCSAAGQGRNSTHQLQPATARSEEVTSCLYPLLFPSPLLGRSCSWLHFFALLQTFLSCCRQGAVTGAKIVLWFLPSPALRAANPSAFLPSFLLTRGSHHQGTQAALGPVTPLPPPTWGQHPGPCSAPGQPQRSPE